MRPYHLFVITGIAAIIFLICQLLLEVYYNRGNLEDDYLEIITSRTPEDYARLFKEVTQPVIVWWEPLSGKPNMGIYRQCGQLSCYFTDDRYLRHHPQTKAFMFYGSNIDFTDLPLPRNGSSMVWALLHEESPRNNAPLGHSAAISLFNYTATFSRFSSHPLTTQYLKDLHVITDMQFFVTTEEKSRLQIEEGLAPVIFLQSDCLTTNDRDSYVVELAKHIKVDSYGKCLHNKDLPPHLAPPNSLATMMSDDLLHLVAKYKFMIAIENGICVDYITEKLWRPLISGSVPIYIGSPTVSDWLPNKKSAVLGLDFESPKALAEYLHRLNANSEEYNSYLSHKLKSEVTNTLLVKTLQEREWATEWGLGSRDFVESFTCFICEKVHKPGEMSVATRKHYSCPMPESIVSRAPNSSNFWLDSWFHGRCEAKVIHDFVASGVENFTKQEYEETLLKLVTDRKCAFNKKNYEDVKLNGE